MATKKDMVFTYDTADGYWQRIVGGKLAEKDKYILDITNGRWVSLDGEASLEEAQKNKHEWVLKNIGFKPGFRVLDIGSGWGPMLYVIKKAGGQEYGVNISPKQVAYYQKIGLNAVVKDWRDIKEGDFKEKFDAIISIGACEHFATPSDYLKGRQKEVYRKFFETCHKLLRPKGVLFLQTMVWGDLVPWANRKFTKNDWKRASRKDLPRNDPYRIIARWEDFFPNAYLPYSNPYLKDIARKYFDCFLWEDGREDYVRTTTKWKERIEANYFKLISLAPRVVFDENIRGWFMYIWEQAYREAFVQRLIGHERMFFRKTG